MDKNKILFAVVLLCIAGITAYCAMNDKIGSALSKKIFNSSFLTGWRISHYLTYVLLTLVFPKYWYILLIVSVLWEAVELTFFGNCLSGEDNSELCQKWTTSGDIDNLLRNALFDITANSLGILTAYLILKYK